MGVEGASERDVAVRFTVNFASYFPGEVAAFHDHEAQALIDEGVAVAHGGGTSTAATLTGGVIADPAALLATLLGFDDAGFHITIDAVPQDIGPLDLTGASDLSSIAAAFGNNMTGAGCVWSTDHFTITTDAKGESATLSYASAPPTGTNISIDCRFVTGAATLKQGT